jgi:hypothetical protein
MPLGSPSIIGPVTTCSTQVRVMGQFSASRVRIYVQGDPVPVGDVVVSWSDTPVAVDRTRLVAGKRLVATQEVGAETSPRSPSGQMIEAAINGTVTISDPIYHCGQSVYLTNCSPGARLEVWHSGAMLGTGDAVGDRAWVDFAPGRRIGAGSPIDVRQFICTSPTPVVTTSAMPQAPAADPNRRLASPLIVEPLEECQRLVPLTGIIRGAIVALTRDGASVWDSTVPLPDVTIVVASLRPGEVFSVTQSMPLCELRPNRPNETRVLPLSRLKRPRIDGPMCAGAHQVTVSRLKPGATLRVFANGAEMGRWEAGAESMPVDVTVPIPATLTAQQELCNIKSPMSRAYTVVSGRSGRWFVVEDTEGDDLKAHSFAIHAALSRTGKIVMFSGDQHNSAQNTARPQDINHCELFDSATFGLERIDSPLTDVFCSGHSFLPDGRLVVAGGTEEFPPGTGAHADHFPGLPDAWLFSPIPDTAGRYWSRARSMRSGRWYPGLVTLTQGQVLAVSGHPPVSDTRHNNNSMELFSAGAGWSYVGDSPDIESHFSTYLYPRICIGPTGGVFSATPLARQFNGDPGRSGTWPGSGTAWTRSSGPVGSGWGRYDGLNTPGVLLPLIENDDPNRSYRFQFLLAGDAAPWVIDLGTPSAPAAVPAWTPLGAGHRVRLNSSLVLLPSGEVLLTGGVADEADDSTAQRDPEMLVLRSGEWTWETAVLARATVPRNYHSTALLTPQGRVFTAGSNINKKSNSTTRGTSAANARA